MPTDMLHAVVAHARDGRRHVLTCYRAGETLPGAAAALDDATARRLAQRAVPRYARLTAPLASVVHVRYTALAVQ